MSYLDWKAGDKFVCVEDRWLSNGGQSQRGIPCPLEKGRIYTIKALVEPAGLYGPDAAPINVVLVEVVREKIPGVKYSAGFNAARFRPVQNRKTSISIFTAMLNPTKVDA